MPRPGPGGRPRRRRDRSPRGCLSGPDHSPWSTGRSTIERFSYPLSAGVLKVVATSGSRSSTSVCSRGSWAFTGWAPSRTPGRPAGAGGRPSSAWSASPLTELDRDRRGRCGRRQRTSVSLSEPPVRDRPAQPSDGSLLANGDGYGSGGRAPGASSVSTGWCSLLIGRLGVRADVPSAGPHSNPTAPGWPSAAGCCCSPRSASPWSCPRGQAGSEQGQAWRASSAPRAADAGGGG